VTFLPLGLDVTNIVVEDNVLHWVEVCNFGFQSVLVSSDGASLEFILQAVPCCLVEFVASSNLWEERTR
jgi:hypothetical protein